MLSIVPSGATNESLTKLGRYTLIARIGSGGMADAHLALQGGLRNFKKLVVLKVINEKLAANPRFVEMLLEEARIAAQLKHPNVVDIYDADCEDSRYFIAMEYLAGQTLTNIIKKGRKTRKLDPYSVSRIIGDAARALDAAHNMRSIAGEPLELVHRDVSPSNVMVLYDGSVKLLDFGVAKARGQLNTNGLERMVPGKLGYAAPEQLDGSGTDRRADIFGLGVVFWESLTHQRLFPGRKFDEVVKNMKTWTPVPPSKLRPGIPSELDSICLRALRMKPEDRFPSAKELNRELEKFLREANYYREASTISDYMSAMFDEERRVIENLAGQVFRGVDEPEPAIEKRPLDMLRRQSLIEVATRLVEQTQADENDEIAAVKMPTDSPENSRHETQIVVALNDIETARERDGRWKLVFLSIAAIAAVVLTIALVQRQSDVSTSVAASAAIAQPSISAVKVNDSPPSESGVFAAVAPTTESESLTALSSNNLGAEMPTGGERQIPSPSGEDNLGSQPVEDLTADEGSRTSDFTQDSGRDEAPQPAPASKPRTEPAKPARATNLEARKLYNEGVRLIATGSLKQAGRRFRQSLVLNPKMTRAHRGLGMVLEKQGSRSAAKRAYRRYLRGSPRAKDAPKIKARIDAL